MCTRVAGIATFLGPLALVAAARTRPLAAQVRTVPLTTAERARLIDLVWLMSVMVLAAAGAFWIWRAYRDRKRGDPEDIEFYGG